MNLLRELARAFFFCLEKIFFRASVSGEENIPRSGPVLIVSNHVTYADVMLIGLRTRRWIRFLMWRPYYENFWLRPLNLLWGAVPVSSGSPKETLRSLRTARALLETGSVVCIFPEGGLTREPRLQPFERGAEFLIRGMDSVAVVPIHLGGLWGHPLSMKGGRTFGAIKLLPLRYPVSVNVGGPVEGEITAERLYERVLELGSGSAP